MRSEALLRAGFPAEAHAEARAAGEGFTEIGAVEHYARAVLACGRASLRWGKSAVAATELAVAERLFSECGAQLMRARAWLVQADVAWSAGDLEAVRLSCKRVLSAELDETAPYLGVQARLSAARVAVPEDATELLDAAARLAVHTGMSQLRVDVLVARARLHRRLGRIEDGIECLRSALRAAYAWKRTLGFFKQHLGG